MSQSRSQRYLKGKKEMSGRLQRKRKNRDTKKLLPNRREDSTRTVHLPTGKSYLMTTSETHSDARLLYIAKVYGSRLIYKFYNITVINQTMQYNDNNPCLEDVSIPVKITDSIFMGDEVIAQVDPM